MNVDPVRALESLSFHEPDMIRATRTRARCHAELERQQRRADPRERSAPAWEPFLVAVVCTAYLAAVVRLAFGFYGLL